jgi:NAD(P)-dependent dehydrogenase (short-subunit alcohol dehydrogenase family)
LAALGFTVYGTARRADRLVDLQAEGVRVLAMDVADSESARLGVETIMTEAGRIDVLVNNAGYGSYGSVEDVGLDEARAQFDVNVFGAATLIRLVLPQMRARGSGTIVNISSMGGRLYTPFGAWYHASKHALEALSDCLRMELAPFGVDVVIIEPGAIRTDWGTIAAGRLRAA